MEETKVEIPAKFKTILESIEKMSVIDLNELVKLLEKKFGFSPVKVEHDANCFLLAEKETGLAKKFKNVFFFSNQLQSKISVVNSVIPMKSVTPSTF